MFCVFVPANGRKKKYFNKCDVARNPTHPRRRFLPSKHRVVNVLHSFSSIYPFPSEQLLSIRRLFLQRCFMFVHLVFWYLLALFFYYQNNPRFRFITISFSICLPCFFFCVGIQIFLLDVEKLIFCNCQDVLFFIVFRLNFYCQNCCFRY